MTDGLTIETTEIMLQEGDTALDLKSVRENLLSLEGVHTVTLENGVLRIEYLSAVVSPSLIRREVERLGLPLAKERKNRNPMKRFIDRMIKSNQETYGSQTLDCCKLNSRTNKGSE